MLIIGGMYISLRYSGECARGIGNGIELCAGVLVPSLFLFMALTAYAVQSGCAGVFASAFGWLARILKLPREAAPAIVLAMIGGYPIGAGCCSLLFESGQLSESEARKTAYIAVAAGPGFVINYIGRSLLSDIRAGNILLAAQVAATLITGFIIGITVSCTPTKDRKRIVNYNAGALADAVNSAARATLRMCAIVILFSGLTEAATSITDEQTADILAAFLEVTTACSRISANAPLYVTAFIVGFGGLSVHFQVYANLTGIRINKALFTLFRLAQGIIAAAITYIYLMIIPMEKDVFSTTQAVPAPAASATLFGSAALVLASVCFIGSISGRLRRLDHVRDSRLA